jgi:hypothetical protein
MKAFAIVFSIIAIGLIILYFVYEDRYITLKAEYEAQVDKDKLVHDEMWKILQSQAGVTSNYAESFTKSYKEIMQARNYGGELMKWIQESNPTFDASMHKKLMESIETYRTKFTVVQTKLISIHQEMKLLLTRRLSGFFLVTIGGYTLPELNIVTSGKTNENFRTGEDNDVNLFQKDTTSH